MSIKTITIATRKTPHAYRQTEFIKARLEHAHPNLIVELKGMMTQGDKLLATPLSKIGGKGLFVKELEKAILERQADIAVHSIKDMPMELTDHLILATICKRDDPRDAFVSNQFENLLALPPGATVGTSSLRRQSQVIALRPDIEVKTLRGNLNTRLRKLDEEQFDAIIVACAGLDRLDESHRIRQRIDIDTMLPAAGQGAIGIECRGDDETLLELLKPLDHKETRVCILAERTLSAELGGSCQVPLAAYATMDGDVLTLRALVARSDGSEIIRTEKTGSTSDPIALGKEAANDLVQQGAKTIIDDLLKDAT